MRLYTAILAITLLFSAGVKAQQEADVTARVHISAQVIQSIELITVNSMSFGKTQPGQRELYVNPTADINAGYMIAIGTPGAEFRLEYLSQHLLTNTSSEGGNLVFTYEISGNNLEEQATSELLREENKTITFNSNGRYYFWVGGRVNLENAVPGNYEGDFTIEIDYI